MLPILLQNRALCDFPPQLLLLVLQRRLWQLWQPFLVFQLHLPFFIPLSGSLTSFSEKKRPQITPLDQSSPTATVLPSFPHPTDVPLNFSVNRNPYCSTGMALPSSSSHSSLSFDDVFLQTLRDNGIECPKANSSVAVQVSLPGRLANINGVVSAKILSSLARAEDWVDLNKLSSV